jgi:hypothetical protein
MTAITLPNSGLVAGYTVGQNGWGAAMNLNLRLIDALLQANAIDKDLNTPPGSPTSGAMYIVGSSPDGAWASHANHLAVWTAGDDLTPSAWSFIIPKEGWRIWVADEDRFYQFDGSAWSSGAGVDGTLLQSTNDGGSSHTFGLDDHNRKRRFTNSGTINVTVPNNSTTAFPIGSLLPFRAVGTGQVVIAGGSGVTINPRDGFEQKSGGQGAEMFLHKVATDEWDLTGDLEAS